MNDEDIRLSRRKVLAGLGTIGIASAGAGLGTTAWLSDEESFLNNVLTAGTLDLLVDYEVYEYQGSAGDYYVSSIDDVKNGEEMDIPAVNGGDDISQELADVKPGDYGYSKFCFTIDTNPAYLWACGALVENRENGQNEAERNHSDDTTGGDPGEGDGELADALDVWVYYCDEEDDVMGGRPSEGGAPDNLIVNGSLREVLAALDSGLPLDGTGDTGAVPPDQEPYEGSGAESPDNPCLCFAWEVPTDVGNEIQSDSVAFDLVFNAIQSRHNDGDANPCCDCGPDEYAVTLPDGQVCCVTPFEGESVSEFYAYETDESFESEIPLTAADTTSLALFDDGSDLYLVVVHDDGAPNGGGLVSVNVSGASAPSSWTIQDDPGDYYSGGEAHWGWSSGKTDGGAAGVGSSGGSLDLTATFAFNEDADNSGASVPNPSGDVTSLRVVSATEESCSVDVDADGDTLDVVLSDLCPTGLDAPDSSA